MASHRDVVSSMSQEVFEQQDEPSGWIFAAILVASLVVHGVTFVSLPESTPPRPASQPVEMTFYEPPPPKVEEPEPPKPPEPEPPKLEPVKVKPKLVAKAEAPPPKEDAPPPPNEEAKEVPQEPVPIVIGVTMDSTSAAGAFAVQVGNTTYGKASDKVVDPASVKAYKAPTYAPPGSADEEPRQLGECKVEYPPEAKKNEIEGSVRLKLTVDETGVVTDVVVITGPGYGLNEAARDRMKRCRFSPAKKHGEAVGYSFSYAYTFILD